MRTARVYLRALEESDLDRTHQWHNDANLYRSLEGTFRHVSLADETRWLREKMQVSGNEINLAICLVEDRVHIGNIYLREIDWVARRAEVHLFIGSPEQRSRGHGEEAIHLISRHAFEDLGLERLFLHVLADNAAAIRAYQKCGFLVEGRLRRHAFKGGTFHDVLVMGLCAHRETTAAEEESMERGHTSRRPTVHSSAASE